MTEREQMRRRLDVLRTTLAAVLLGLLPTLSSQAQEPNAQLRVSRGPYYVGIPMDIQLHATGLDREPEPTCDTEAPPNGSLRLVSMIPNVSTQISIVNGRTTRSETVTFICQYQYTPRIPGQHTFSAFRIAQGQQILESAPYAIRAEALAADPKLRLRIQLPDDPVYIGQQVPVEVEWWIDERLQQSIQDYAIRSELFEDPDTYRFLEEQDARGQRQTLNLQTKRGQLLLPARAEQREYEGEQFVVLTAERTLIPLRSGTFELAGATVNASEVTSWRRDLFGGRRPAATRPIFAQDVPRTLVVKPAPTAGRPSSFGGAIGRGFSFGVETDRSVVQTGEPIVLTFTVNGSGELNPVGLPPLDTLLPTDRFRLPEDEISGQVVAGTKAFRVPVRVIDESVTEIPALPYSWFDPELGEYQTTHSRPIALSVRPAQLISAADVVSAHPEQAQTKTSEAQETAPQANDESAFGWSSGESGADLAIELDRERLSRRSGLSNSGQVAVYGLSAGLLALTWGIRRKRDANPDKARLRTLQKTQRQRIEATRGRATRESLTEITAALRELAGSQPGTENRELETFITECDNILYSPGESEQDADLNRKVDRALALADGIISPAAEEEH